MKAYWIATLSDGTTAIEYQGEWDLIPGQRKPWVRLIDQLQAEGKFITSLRLRVGKRTIHLPKPSSRFESYCPLYYSLCYQADLDDALGSPVETHYVDLAAHFENFAVHYIQDITHGNTSWITVTAPDALAPSPRREGD